ncbi:hypothetical protein [Alteromonas stellipolaris]|uniref:hypothetical protein n=1 Tax=Alteromonas stellipolaris TaxID=233316 RepID=UPI0026E2C90E|nr:hypothetical protein [Alteromonas stellipolaris]MDO6533852.1 hypothetical protein [Alteromonas stellipolaris]MDO6626254.1 hypothetical protein [Alteromonas stellipolaris]
MTKKQNKPLCEIELKQISLKKRNEAILKIIASELLSISSAYSELDTLEAKSNENNLESDDEN